MECVGGNKERTYAPYVLVIYITSALRRDQVGPGHDGRGYLVCAAGGGCPPHGRRRTPDPYPGGVVSMPTSSAISVATISSHRVGQHLMSWPTPHRFRSATVSPARELQMCADDTLWTRGDPHTHGERRTVLPRDCRWLDPAHRLGPPPARGTPLLGPHMMFKARHSSITPC